MSSRSTSVASVQNNYRAGGLRTRTATLTLPCGTTQVRRLLVLSTLACRLEKVPASPRHVPLQHLISTFSPVNYCASNNGGCGTRQAANCTFLGDKASSYEARHHAAILPPLAPCFCRRASFFFPTPGAGATTATPTRAGSLARMSTSATTTPATSMPAAPTRWARTFARKSMVGVQGCGDARLSYRTV